MIMNELLAELERAGTLRKLCIACATAWRFASIPVRAFSVCCKSAMAMGSDDEMTASQAIMSANAPMIIQKAMVDGEPALGVLPSGQVAGVIDDLPPCEELINPIVAEAQQRLSLLAAAADKRRLTMSKPFNTTIDRRHCRDDPRPSAG